MDEDSPQEIKKAALIALILPPTTYTIPPTRAYTPPLVSQAEALLYLYTVHALSTKLNEMIQIALSTQVERMAETVGTYKIFDKYKTRFVARHENSCYMCACVFYFAEYMRSRDGARPAPRIRFRPHRCYYDDGDRRV